MRTLNRGAVLTRGLLIGVALVFPAQAGQLSVKSGGWTNSTECVGTLHITSETPAVNRGTLTIRGVDAEDDPQVTCDAVCGNGIVEGLEECDPGGNEPGCSSNCRILHFPMYATGESEYLDDWTELDACRSLDPPVENSTSGRDVTFLAFGDPQYGNNNYIGEDSYSVHGPGIQKNKLDASSHNIDGLNRIEQLVWPSGFEGEGQAVSDVRGVIIAGDLTQEGDACTTDYTTPGFTCGYILDQDMRDHWFTDWPNDPDHEFPEYKQFRDEYGLCGDKKLHYPVFEGAGNHDYWRDVHEEFEHPVHDYIAYRNNFRQGLDRVDPLGKGHYSWTWDDVHFVQLNLAATDITYVDEGVDENENITSIRTMKPYSALAFLEYDLAKHAVGGKPVVLISHYPWIGSSRFSSAHRLALLHVIKHYNVIALIHGHTHGSWFSIWSPCDDVPGNCAATLGLSTPPRDIPVIDAGNPLYGNGRMRVHTSQSDSQRYGHYSVIRITDDFLEVSSVSWKADGSHDCDNGSESGCESHWNCDWDANEGRCYANTEICLPGVTTLACKPGEPCNSDPSGGWAAKIDLATGAKVRECQRPLFEYCGSSDPEEFCYDL